MNWENMRSREKDVWLAENLFHWNRANEFWYDSEGVEVTRLVSPDGIDVTAYGHSDECDYDQFGDELPHYTTEISAAWQVVDAMRAKGWDLWLKSVRFNNESEWRILFYGGPTYDPDNDETWSKDLTDGLCKAAYMTLPEGER